MLVEYMALGGGSLEGPDAGSSSLRRRLRELLEDGTGGGGGVTGISFRMRLRDILKVHERRNEGRVQECRGGMAEIWEC